MPGGGHLTVTGRPVDEEVEILFQDTAPASGGSTEDIFEPFFSTKEAAPAWA